jgi:hypothetical protein
MSVLVRSERPIRPRSTPAHRAKQKRSIETLNRLWLRKLADTLDVS